MQRVVSIGTLIGLVKCYVTIWIFVQLYEVNSLEHFNCSFFFWQWIIERKMDSY